MPWEYPVIEAHASRQICIVRDGEIIKDNTSENNNYKLIAEFNFENNFVRIAIYQGIVKDGIISIF